MDDWIRLLVKYKGKCSACGSEISTGEYALWSKNAKTIKHIECKIQPTTITEKTNKGKKMLPAEAAEVDCFICDKPVAYTTCGFEGDYGSKATSHACICDICLKDKNAYQNYQQAFLKKAHKLAKIII